MYNERPVITTQLDVEERKYVGSSRFTERYFSLMFLLARRSSSFRINEGCTFAEMLDPFLTPYLDCGKQFVWILTNGIGSCFTQAVAEISTHMCVAVCVAVKFFLISISVHFRRKICNFNYLVL